MEYGKLKRAIEELKKHAWSLDRNPQSKIHEKINNIENNFNNILKICKYFKVNGFCPYGRDCWFRHFIVPRSITCLSNGHCRYYNDKLHTCDYSHDSSIVNNNINLPTYLPTYHHGRSMLASCFLLFRRSP
jgi:hypothetical protein